MLQSYQRVPNVPIGYYPGHDQMIAGKADQGYPGCMNGWSPMRWNYQEWSFILSWVVQIGILIVSSIALAKEGIPETLALVLLLETIVQGVEITWYTIVGGAYLFGKMSIDVGYRYADWLITTPVMLTTLFFFGLWDANRCVRLEDLLGYDGSRVVAFVVMIVSDVLMLAVGAAYANARTDGNGFFADLARWYDGLVWFSSEKHVGIFLGWVFFLGAFAPLFVLMITDSFRVGGQLTIILSFITWALYGVVAVAKDYAKSLSPITSNALYNILDLIAKNILGLVVSIVVLNGNYKPADLQCTMVGGRPWEASLL